MSTRLLVQSIPRLNSLVLRQEGGNGFFIAADNSIIISVKTLAYILQFLVNNNYLSEKVISGILEEYNTSKGDTVDRIRKLVEEREMIV
jgi:hypothetical protein